MRTLHHIWAPVMIAANLGVAFWGLFVVRKNPSKEPAFLRAFIVAVALVAVQVVLGVITMNQMGMDAGFHAFYGFVVLIAGILAYAARGDDQRKRILILSLAALFIGAVSIRGWTVAGR